MAITLRTIMLFVLSSATLLAQNSDAPIAFEDIYLLQNVQLVASPTASPVLTDVYIDQGMIKEIGKSINVPYNTQMIDLDSMYMYAGFIDPLSHTGIAAPDKDKEKIDKAKDPGNPSYEQAGISPQAQAKEQFSEKDKSIAAMRKHGFTLSHIVPRGGMITGQSAIIFNRDGAKDELVLAENQALFAQLKSANGVYPATLIGVISRFSELMQQAKQAYSYEQKASRSIGLERASYPEELKALYPVVNKEKKVFFKAEEAKNIHRVLTLAKKNDLNVVLAEMRNSWNLIDRIKATNSSVLLSLDLPKLDEEKPDSTKSEEKVDARLEVLIKKQKEAKARYHKQAAIYEEANVNFAFSYLDTKAKDVLKNIKAAIEAGLSEKTALATLTTQPAAILGISNIAGTVEKGKLANLVLTDKPLFDEKTKIKYVFVEGKKYDYTEIKKAAKIEKSELDKIVGSWSYTMEIPIPQNTGTIKIKNDSGDLLLFISLDAEPNEAEEITDAVFEDGKLSFSFVSDTEMGSMNIAYNLKIDEDTMEGTVTAGDFGTFPVTGSKKSNPE